MFMIRQVQLLFLLADFGLPFEFRFNCDNFIEPALMALFGGEASAKECAHKFERYGLADDAPAQDEHVHVIVLDSLMS